MGRGNPKGNPNIRSWQPPKESIWKCPCGKQDKWPVMCGHRRGYAKRPACAKGNLAPVSPDAFPPHWPKPADTGPVESEMPGAHAPDIAADTSEVLDQPADEITPEYTESGGVANAEEIAALLNRQSVSAGIDLGTFNVSDPPSYDPFGFRPLTGIPASELALEPPAFPSGASEETINCRLPIYARAMYDYMRSNGWHEGDGSFSMWNWCMLRYLWGDVFGLEFGVFSREELGVEQPGNNGRRLSQQDAAKHN